MRLSLDTPPPGRPQAPPQATASPCRPRTTTPWISSRSHPPPPPIKIKIDSDALEERLRQIQQQGHLVLSGAADIHRTARRTPRTHRYRVQL